MDNLEQSLAGTSRRVLPLTDSARFAIPLWAAAALVLAVLLRLYLVLALPYGWTVENRLEGLNDEPAHYNYTKYLVEHKRLPVLTRSAREPDSFLVNDFEYHQPPLYYSLCIPAYVLFGERAGLYVGRVLSLLFAFAGLLMLLLTLRRLGAPRHACWGAVAFVALWLNHAYFSSVLSNDSLSWLFALLLSWEGAAYAKERGEGGHYRRAARIGLWLGLGLWTKSSLAIFGPAVVVLYGYLWWRNRTMLYVRALVIAVGTALLIAFPWYVRNLLLYHEPFVVKLVNGPWMRSLWVPEDFVVFFKAATYHFWFPMIHVPPSRLNGAYNAAGALLLLAFAVMAVLHVARRRSTDPGRVFVFSVLLLNLVGYIRYNLHWRNEDGRFLFPSLAAIMLLMFVPLKERLGPAREKIFPVAVYLLAAFTWLPLLLV
jgi:4-amino-4-deoxy-L-arabinose transferase-like glycosyltransferase